MTNRSFPLVGGRVMRVTRLDGCGRVDTTDPLGVQVTSDGFVSIEVSANVDDGDAITVVKANGKNAVNEQPAPSLTGYGVQITFSGVDVDIFELVTGQYPILDPATGKAVGFRVNTAVDASNSGFALEVWSRVPGVQCPTDENGNIIEAAAEASGYILFPFLKGGTFGDFTIENDAISFVVQGAQTKDGAGWGKGPYNVTLDADGHPGPLIDPVEPNDHLLVQISYVLPPEETNGITGIPALTATAGNPATVVPAGSVAPANAAAANSANLKASPTTAWTAGQYLQGSISGAPGQMFWNGTAWVPGKAA